MLLGGSYDTSKQSYELFLPPRKDPKAALPAILGLVMLYVVFGLASDSFLGIATNIAFALEHIQHVAAQLGRRRQDRILARLLAIANAGEHITQGIGHRHIVPLPARLSETGNQALVAHFPKHDPRQAELAIKAA